MASGKGSGRDLSKEREWCRQVGRQERSGKSVLEFCRSEGLDAGRFYDWRQKLRERDGEGRKGSDVFVPVELGQEDVAGPSWGIEIELGDVVKVRVGAVVDEGTLVTALKALGVERC